MALAFAIVAAAPIMSPAAARFAAAVASAAINADTVDGLAAGLLLVELWKGGLAILLVLLV